jgi:hypothetical protein
MRKLLIGCAVMIASVSVFGQQQSAFVGTWRLDPARSQTKIPANDVEFLIVTEKDGQVTFGPSADGLTVISKLKSKSSSYPLKGGRATMPAFPGVVGTTTRVNPNVLDTAESKDGRVIGHERTEISGDGKVMTRTIVGVGEDRSKVNERWVYTKQ